MSVLGKEGIREYLRKKKLSDRLVITPLLDHDLQVGDSSIDLRLGNDFIVTRKGNLPFVSPRQDSAGLAHYHYQAKHHINFGDKFYLHPQELVLAGTLEYLRLPNKLSGFVTSRSKWGRVGLVIATAVAIAPGFAGSITLELINLGEVPLELYPGIRVAQLVLEECTGASEYTGELSCYTGPQFGNVATDADIRLVTELGKRDTN